MYRILDPRWNSKKSLFDSVRNLATSSGWEIHRLGYGDTFQIQKPGENMIVIALKESGQKSTQERRTHWIGIPRVLEQRVCELLEQNSLGAFMFFFIDHWDQHLLTIPGGAVVRAILARDTSNPHPSFDVKKTTTGYSLIISRGDPAVALQNIDTLQPLQDLLSSETSS